MKKMKNSINYLLTIVSIFILSSCDNNESVSETRQDLVKTIDNLYDSNSNLKRQFGKALMLTLNDSKALRDLIKKKSLEMFDNDYEVLYQMIKNEKLENNLTLRENILKNLGNENLLSKIELNNPTLTILVPQLPENSFSARIWDTENQIPKVAIRLDTSNDVPIINQDGSESIIEGKYIPSFPIIVIKDNERVIASSSNSIYGKLKTRTFKNGNGISFKFLDDCFDKEKSIKMQTSRSISSLLLDQKIIQANNIYQTNDGWHRDFIYYDITPSNPNGSFNYDFQETLKSFVLQGDPIAAYNKISDQTGDAKWDLQKGRLSSSSWSGGYFEFKVRTIVNAKNGVGSEIVKYFTARGDDLFDLVYRRVGLTFIISSISLKKMSLNIPIFNWDIEQYATTVKIEIEEIDLTETFETTDTRAVEFATNFGIEGTLKKIGLKFGASLKKNESVTTKKTYTQGNDLLGDVIVNFADKIIIGTGDFDSYITREYSSGSYSISIEPARVQ